MAEPRIDSISPWSQHRASHKPCVLKIYQLLFSVVKDRKNALLFSPDGYACCTSTAFLNLRSFHGRHGVVDMGWYVVFYMAILQLALRSPDFVSPVSSICLCPGTYSGPLITTLHCVTKRTLSV